MNTKPPRYLLADRILRDTQGKSLREWVFEQRKRLQPVSWNAITERLAVATAGDVAVTQLTLRAWFAEDLQAERDADDAEDVDDDAETDPGVLAAVAS